ncbi:alpha/beta hydrolase [Subtercola boreus]|uniref:Alpha/beta hydrolase n=1 Tax=Subtercola boreus TaxID=120213 RepID=A0A3E0VAE5_9MICO|nr:alpha/beta hydrolase [Subtercola boreus]
MLDSLEKAKGYGSVHNSPNLPLGFTDVFESYLVEANGIRQHAIIGGSGRPLLLLGGWPQNWYAWRLLMLPLAESFTVIAVDQRGVGLSEKALSGYDSTSLAKDMADLMSALGYETFAMVGHDIGASTGYAVAADYPDRVERIALGEMIMPGVSASPELIPDDRRLSDFLWHFNFNRTLAVNEQLVRGREDIYIGHQFDTKAGSPDAVPEHAREFYIESVRRDPEALRCSFDYYRAIDDCIPQNRARMKTKISVPMLTFAGSLACGDGVELELRLVADNITESIMIECGHYVMDENPEPLLKALISFFAPYAAGDDTKRLTTSAVS